ncbi:hypothetical protein N7462_011439 [Penicillium macrosclerotiorum]|uniref:uncharacterized protein n=1 Tax=Penicillium macrosclerotiorum TaxID=303699 RepID=UPI002546EE6A|nr:uncharacterized protein N7462_011439 [Penicillium macrosclerotiorum]KAJ5664626.1 hypothetical protein N7462_011439 [Penicillium macrosclerotiorum]
MPLVQYSDSESEADAPESPPPAKKPRHETSRSGFALPPLPAAFHDLYASSTRVRYPSKDELALLTDLIPQSKSTSCPDAQEDDSPHAVHSLLQSDLGAQLPLHISLSRPVVLRTEQRAAFSELLQASIQDSHISPLKWVANHERTRWFLVLHVARPASDGLNRLLELSNRALAQYDQPPLYATPHKVRQSRVSMASAHGDMQPVADFSDCFHISLAWSLVGPSLADAQRVAGIDLGSVRGLRVRFDSVKAKIGNQVESIRLPVDV